MSKIIIIVVATAVCIAIGTLVRYFTRTGVFQEPSRLTMWNVSIAPTIPDPHEARMVIPSPINWLYLVGIVIFVRYLDRRRATLKEAEKNYKAGMKTFMENNDELFNQLVDTDTIRKYDSRIVTDIEYGQNHTDGFMPLHHRAKTTLASILY
jgi:hypothetical protein